jgi:hypothetical protein
VFFISSALGSPADLTARLRDVRFIHEAFYVLEGSGIFTLNDARHPFDKGGMIFHPKNAWDQPVAVLAVSYVLPILLLPIALCLIRLRA